ncbi:MAG: hypothetical protein DME39_06630 [Verrucomicrobia bacterium]|nr:MAG: hypothetical protein DME95_05665 [Verrucomicrobiota bacterium]PYK05014.1 MAG: hypothetical protein DME67_06570 [Verrucomicrobiota bacterium]PYK74615.1 MAG: hypothetical protein DME39_06630 [Verrucomicrobiota bacterium]
MFRKFAFLAFAIAVLSGAFGLASAEAEEELRGIVLMNVDSKTGRVTSARMLQSTGVQVVDATLLEQFSRMAVQTRDAVEGENSSHVQPSR